MDATNHAYIVRVHWFMDSIIIQVARLPQSHQDASVVWMDASNHAYIVRVHWFMHLSAYGFPDASIRLGIVFLYTCLHSYNVYSSCSSYKFGE